MAYLRHYPQQIKTFYAPATMKSRLEADLKEAKLQEEVAQKAKMQEEIRAKQQEEARQAISNNTQYEPASNNQSTGEVKTNSSSISDDNTIALIIIGFVVVATTFGVVVLGKLNNNTGTKPKLAQKSTAQKTPTKKTPTGQQRPAVKSPTKRATTKKKLASKPITESASGSRMNDDSLNPGDSEGIEAQLVCLQQLFDRGQISEEEMDQKIRKILTGSS